MTDEANVERALDRVAAAGGDVAVLAPHVRELVREDLTPDEIILRLRRQTPQAFPPSGPPDVDVDALTERERMDYVDKHGVDVYVRQLARASEKRQREMQRKTRGG